MKVVVIDTETTGFTKPVVPVQVCMIELLGKDPKKFVIGDVCDMSFNPGKPIEFGAMSTHFISNEIAATYFPWDKSVLPHADMYIGHSVDYDWEAVGSPDVKRVCTLAMTRRAWPDVDTHKLGALLVYLLGPEKAFPKLQRAHQAQTDAMNLCSIIQRLAIDWEIGSWSEMWGMSEECRIPINMSFGKYGPDQGKGTKGILITDMVKKDWSYCTWLLGLDDLDPYLRKAIMQARG